MLKIVYSLTFVYLLIGSGLVMAAVPENLTEMFARKDRILDNSYTYNQSLLENSSNSYIWQPETLMYKDVETGHEVWRMTNTPNLMNYYHNDIGVSPWSADGKRLAFWTYNRNTSAFTGEEKSYMWMLVDADGKYLKPIVNGPSRQATGYFHWSPQIPDTYYEYGSYVYRPWSERNLFNTSKIYKATVSDTDVSAYPLLSFSFGSPNMGKYISADGRMIIVDRYINDTSPHMLYPAIIYPETQASVLLPEGYSQWRNFGPYGGTPSSPARYHDAYYAADGSWYFAMPDIGSTWWRIKTLGSASDGGALYIGDNGNSYFGEVWPENHGTVSDGNICSPFVQIDPYTQNKTSYWSHFVPDLWGRYALFSNNADNLPGSGDYIYNERVGPGVWDIEKHTYSVPSFGGGAQHHDWHGFTDWVVSSVGPSGTGSYLNDRIYTAKYNEYGTRETVCYTHTRYNGGTQYNSLARPGQSPDGTKVAWQSEFLNPGADKTDIFWAVVYNPYPPTNLSAAYNGGVDLFWLPPRYTDRDWPYTSSSPQKDSLGWPLLDQDGKEIGETLYAREISTYHIWRATSENGPWKEIGTKTAEYSYTYAEDPDMFMLHPVSDGLKVGPTNKISYRDNPGCGTFYYTITSEEYSGLESDELSKILKVTVSGSTLTQSVAAEKGQKNFWRTPPLSPQNFKYNHTETLWLYRLSWAEPEDTKVRYYNIYYSNLSNPVAKQEYRIASVPKGTTSYIDWLADTGSPGYYGITSVDRYGNEGVIVTGGATCILPADNSPCDSEISTIELSDNINRWLKGNILLRDIIGTIKQWKI
jgi:hypothetical protein